MRLTVSDQANTPEPPHALGALTTAEISRYKRELEHCLKHLPEHATVRQQIREKLQTVIDEESIREQHRHSSQRWPLHN
jgi:uncharacterized membrane protein